MIAYGHDTGRDHSFLEEDTIVLGGYLPHYRMTIVSPDIFDYLTHLYYFCLSPDSSGNLGQIDAEGLFTPLEALPKVDEHMDSLLSWRGEKAVKIFLVIGGFSGSDFFAEAVSDPGTRAMLVANIKSFIGKYGIDGVDLDWETYKGEEEEANYGILVDDLRSAFEGTNLQISAAVNPLHTRMIDAFSSADFIQLMSYGRHFGEDTQVPMSTLQEWVDAWVDGGFPKSKLVIGIPFFGKTTVDNSSILYRTIIDLYNTPPEVDKVIHDGKMFFFNGVETVARKGQYVLDEQLKGAMVWETGQDVSLNDSRSLLRSVHKTIFSSASASCLDLQEARTIKIFPNPSRSIIYLETDLKEAMEFSLFVYDVFGRLILSSDLVVSEGKQRLELEVQELPPGDYFIRLEKGKESFTSTFIKQ